MTSPKNTGFTLIELMVVISLVGILSASVTVGFGKVTQDLQTKQAASAVQDVMERLELETLSGEYEKNTLHFEKNYLEVASQPQEVKLQITWEGTGLEPCSEEEGKLSWKEEGALFRRDKSGANLENLQTLGEEEKCIGFQTSNETEWRYQTQNNEGKFSDEIRLIHFDLDRKAPSGIKLKENDYQLQIEAPNGKKILLQDGSNLPFPQSLTLNHPSGAKANVPIQ